MNWLGRFKDSNIGLKVAMALSGVVLLGFVFVHMLGNLQIFLDIGEFEKIAAGETALDHYGAMLQGNKELLWGARITLIAAVVIHIVTAVKLTMRNRAARPVAYKVRKTVEESYAARTMRVGGFIVLAFIIFHLMHLTMGRVDEAGFQHCTPPGDDFRCFVYSNVVAGFQNIGVVAFYIIAQLALALHLSHGVASLFRTLGMNNPRFEPIVNKLAIGFATIVAVGNCAIPLAVTAGLLTTGAI
jgi:succinate dehydrogenase / fumarate reductase, cytochrome b subunit